MNLWMFLVWVSEQEIFTEIRATNGHQNVGIFNIFCSGKSRVCYSVHWNQICHSVSRVITRETSKSSICLQKYNKMGSKLSRLWNLENLKSIWKAIHKIWVWRKGCYLFQMTPKNIITDTRPSSESSKKFHSTNSPKQIWFVYVQDPFCERIWKTWL